MFVRSQHFATCWAILGQYREKVIYAWIILAQLIQNAEFIVSDDIDQWGAQIIKKLDFQVVCLSVYHIFDIISLRSSMASRLFNVVFRLCCFKKLWNPNRKMSASETKSMNEWSTHERVLHSIGNGISVSNSSSSNNITEWKKKWRDRRRRRNAMMRLCCWEGKKERKERSNNSEKTKLYYIWPTIEHTTEMRYSVMIKNTSLWANGYFRF